MPDEISTEALCCQSVEIDKETGAIPFMETSGADARQVCLFTKIRSPGLFNKPLPILDWKQITKNQMQRTG